MTRRHRMGLVPSGERGTQVAAAVEAGGAPVRPAALRMGALIHRPPSDAALIRAAQAGSEAAVEALFARHWPDAFRAAHLICRDRAGAEDIAQEAFLAVIRTLDRFDRRRPLRPWLHRIVVNRAIDWSRARTLRREVAMDGVPEPAAEPPRACGALGQDVVDALAELGPEQRAVIVLRYLLDLTPGEIASVLELPRGTVNSRLRRGLDALAARLEEAES